MRELDPIESMHYSTGECLVVEIDYKDIGKDAVLDWIYKNIPYYQLYVTNNRKLDRNEKLQLNLQETDITDIKTIILKRHNTYELMYGFNMTKVHKLCLFISHIVIDGRQAAHIFKKGFLDTQLMLKLPPIQMFQTIGKYFNQQSYNKFKKLINDKTDLVKSKKNKIYYQQWRTYINNRSNNDYAEIYIKDIDQWIHKYNQKLSTLTILLKLLCIKEQHTELFNTLLEEKQFYLYQPIAVDYRDPEIDINTTGTFSTPGFIFFKLNIESTISELIVQLVTAFNELKEHKYSCLMASDDGEFELPSNTIYGFEQSNVGKINLDQRIQIYNYLRGQIGDSFVFSFLRDSTITIRLYFSASKYDAKIIEDQMTQISAFITNPALHKEKLVSILQHL